MIYKISDKLAELELNKSIYSIRTGFRYYFHSYDIVHIITVKDVLIFDCNNL